MQSVRATLLCTIAVLSMTWNSRQTLLPHHCWVSVIPPFCLIKTQSGTKTMPIPWHQVLERDAASTLTVVLIFCGSSWTSANVSWVYLFVCFANAWCLGVFMNVQILIVGSFTKSWATCSILLKPNSFRVSSVDSGIFNLKLPHHNYPVFQTVKVWDTLTEPPARPNCSLELIKYSGAVVSAFSFSRLTAPCVSVWSVHVLPVSAYNIPLSRFSTKSMYNRQEWMRVCLWMWLCDNWCKLAHG